MLSQCASVEDFRAVARRKLPHFLFEYFDSSSFDGTTSDRNRSDFDAIDLVHHTLSRDATRADKPDLRTTIFGQELALPIVLSPVGLAGAAWPRGEAGAAKAASAAGTTACLSSTSICDIGEVARHVQPWFQLYLMRDREVAARMLHAAENAGCRTLVLTVDTPVLGVRRRDARSGINDSTAWGKLRRGGQIAARPGWAMRMARTGLPITLGNISTALGGNVSFADCMAYTANGLERQFDSAALRWLRDKWPHNLVIKGLTEPEDAKVVIAHGIDGIIVSNHGGRQLDGVRSSIRSLVAIRQATQDRIPLVLDSGVRSGIDVVKALALGASAVMIGRPWVYALGSGGRAGVTRLLECLAREVEVAMELCGIAVADQLRSSGIATIPQHWREGDSHRQSDPTGSPILQAAS